MPLPRPAKVAADAGAAGEGDSADSPGLSRRSFLRVTSGALGGAWLTLDWSAVLAAAHDAHQAIQTAGTPLASFLTESEAADVEAIAAQIIPSDTTAGAREAGVVFFIDRALATFFARMAPSFRAGLADFRSVCCARHPAVTSFAALTSDQQIAILETVEKTAFFEKMRLLTVIGMFAMPQYGGNRDGLGWKLLGFEDRHVFEPPFGYYDRDYPGFTIEYETPA